LWIAEAECASCHTTNTVKALKVKLLSASCVLNCSLLGLLTSLM